jgi:glycosyltransferase involved in cell wall biosynthesis
MSPAISVLLPVKDVAPWLEECLRSLLAQSFGDFEVIAVDDGSTDATEEVFRRVAADDPRFSLVRADGRGLVPALNQAAALGSGAWLARMDGDDVCEPRRLELQYELAVREPGLAVVSSLVRIFPRPLLPGMERYERWLNGLATHERIVAERFVESPLAHPSVLMRRDLFEAAGGYVDRGWPEDYDLWLRLAEAGHRFVKVPQVLLHWRDRPTRTSRTQPEYQADAFRACKLHHLQRAFPMAQGVAILGAGPLGKTWSRLLRGAGVPVRCHVEVHPRRIGREIGGIPVVSYQAVQGLGPLLLLGAVGSAGAREAISAFFERHPLTSGQTLVFLA